MASVAAPELCAIPTDVAAIATAKNFENFTVYYSSPKTQTNEPKAEGPMKELRCKMNRPLPSTVVRKLGALMNCLELCRMDRGRETHATEARALMLRRCNQVPQHLWVL
jgi:hypothetical protein